MAVTYGTDKQTTSAAFRLAITGVVGVAVLVCTGLVASWKLAPLLGWEAAAAIYLGWTWLTVVRLDDKLTGDYARREDPSRALTDATVILASVISLGALWTVLIGSRNNESAQVSQIALGVLSVVLSWLVVHTVYMLRYAELYYAKPVGGVDFEGTDKPTYTDFAYLAFTVGMTFQVSDTGYRSSKFRSTTLKHALLSYLFGTIIVASTVNLVAGLSK
jgi:uncharacterized membrane protein